MTGEAKRPGRIRRALEGMRRAEWWRWKLWGLLVRHPRVCPANAHGALIWRSHPWWQVGVDRTCRDLGNAPSCWCGKLRREDAP